MDAQETATPLTEDSGSSAGCHHHAHQHSPSYEADRARILTRLRRIEGQVRGVHKMVEEEKYCVDILTQISAIVAGLRATGLVILEDHIRGCVMSAEDDEQEAFLDELMGAIERFNRSVG
ncbi:MAG: metal-sensitive transcriptional regulator [Thermomicrobiales bacterium]